jgi:hypothetical protein
LPPSFTNPDFHSLPLEKNLPLGYNGGLELRSKLNQPQPSTEKGQQMFYTTHGKPAQNSGSSSRLKDQPIGERPRERLIERGAAALSAAELIAILVRTGL